jgi:hypothetical protein
MKSVSLFVIIASLVSCNTKPFVKHSLSFEKIADNCSNQSANISMNSNLNGERFVFESCLDADFTKAQVTSTQPNDSTVLINFERKNAEQALYKLTIDLDAYPRYSLLIIDRDSIRMQRVEP